METKTRWGAWVSLFCVALFSGLIISLHFLSPEFLPIHHSLSQYARGEYGYLAQIAFGALAVGLFMFGYMLVVEVPEEGSSKFGAFLLLVAGFSLIIVALFPADPGDAAETVQGKLHDFSLNSFILLFLAGSLFVSFKLRTWKRSGLGALVLSLLSWAAYFWYRAAPEGSVGLQQRALFGLMVLWMLWVGAMGARRT